MISRITLCHATLVLASVISKELTLARSPIIQDELLTSFQHSLEAALPNKATGGKPSGLA